MLSMRKQNNPPSVNIKYIIKHGRTAMQRTPKLRQKLNIKLLVNELGIEPGSFFLIYRYSLVIAAVNGH